MQANQSKTAYATRKALPRNFYMYETVQARKKKIIKRWKKEEEHTDTEWKTKLTKTYQIMK